MDYGGDIHCICLKLMRKYEDSKGTNHTTVGLAWRRRHIFIVNSDDREGLRATDSYPRAKPKASDTKSRLIYKRAFADFL